MKYLWYLHCYFSLVFIRILDCFLRPLSRISWFLHGAPRCYSRAIRRIYAQCIMWMALFEQGCSMRMHHIISASLMLCLRYVIASNPPIPLSPTGFSKSGGKRKARCEGRRKVGPSTRIFRWISNSCFPSGRQQAALPYLTLPYPYKAKGKASWNRFPILQ